MSLRKLFEEDSDGKYKSHLGSGGEALLEEKNHEYYEENPEQENDDSSGMDQMGGLGPNDNMMAQNGPSVPDVRAIDRFIRIKGWPVPGKGEKGANSMWEDPEFLETLKTNFLNDLDQKKILRKLRDVYDLYEGDGNEAIAAAHGKILGAQVLMKHSSTENNLEANERVLWAESRQTNKNIVHNKGGNGGRSSGFLARLFGK
jgi:hypothetical protein